MATKINPGAYDCYENAEPDEPMFVLLARDELAPHLTRLWALIRDCAPKQQILHEVDRAREIADSKPVMNEAKYKEAMICADTMVGWRQLRGQ